MAGQAGEPKLPLKSVTFARVWVWHACILATAGASAAMSVKWPRETSRLLNRLLNLTPTLHILLDNDQIRVDALVVKQRKLDLASARYRTVSQLVEGKVKRPDGQQRWAFSDVWPRAAYVFWRSENVT